LASLAKCRTELRYFPTLADIILRIQMNDGHPGVEEAWSLCPKSESESAVWTRQIREAYFAASNSEDPIAARMAFKEKYATLLTKARADRKPATWEFSPGQDKLHRERVLTDAVAKGLITADAAQAFLPDISFARTREATKLVGPPSKQKMLESSR
jgi:hypothetical protein